MRILLIDDDEEFRKELQLWLTDTLKHSVAVAGSVVQAKQQLQQDRYDAILLDGRLRNSVDDRMDPNPTGGVSGLEVLRTLSATQLSKTIWMTAHHMDDLSDPALLGCNRFLFKRWGRITLDTSPYSNQFQKKLQGHLDSIVAKRPDVLTMILGGFAILLVGTGVIWQIVEDFTPALLAALVGTIVNLVTFLSILTGRPLRRRRP